MNLNDLFDRLKKALNPDQPAQSSAPVPQQVPAQQPAPVQQPEPAKAPETAPEDPFDESFDLAVSRSLLAKITMQTSKPFLQLTLTDQVPGIRGSKVGGVPYLPDDAEVPCDADGCPLQMLAQIDCTELSALPEFPHEGLLQFWIGQDVSYGLFTEGGSRVIYYPQTDSSVTEETVRARLAALPKPAESDSPLNGAFGISMSMKIAGVSAQDVHFNPLFVRMFNEEMPEHQITDLSDLGDEIGETVYEEQGGFGHKIGGYPGFTQWDPRKEDDPRTVLLFQLDSDYGDGHTKVMWGDAGIGGFFCSPEALAARDFSDVLYNWDCG